MTPRPASLPQSLYVHIPFCASRCGYCTFTSTVYVPEKADAYLAALEKELRARNVFRTDADADALPETVFIGGGTPSVLSLAQMERLFSFLPKSKSEFTCEINPDSCSREKLEFLRDHGVNRLSFGVQTFDPDGLKLLQRRHSWDQAVDAVRMAAAMGFSSVSVDLINGWPRQTERCVREDIERAVDSGVHHISSYNLILEPSAAGYARYCELLGGEIADEDVGRRNWEIIEETLESKGFTHYETSNFSRPGFACMHNVMTWKGEEYLGIGLGACSHCAGVRWGNIEDLERYCRDSGKPEAVVAYSEKLEGEAKARECAVFWLRLFEGVDLRAFAKKTGFDFREMYRDVLPGLAAEGIVAVDANNIRVEKKFHPVLDSILEYFI